MFQGVNAMGVFKGLLQADRGIQVLGGVRVVHFHTKLKLGLGRTNIGVMGLGR